MNIEIIGDSTAGNAIKTLTEAWDAHLAAMDLDKLLEHYAPDTCIFDVGSQFNGQQRYREQWATCFPYFGDSVRIERRQIRIHAASDLALLHCYARVSGPNTPPAEQLPWMRTTVCFQLLNGVWVVVHEHVSVPYDFATGTATLILGEPDD